MDADDKGADDKRPERRLWHKTRKKNKRKPSSVSHIHAKNTSFFWSRWKKVVSDLRGFLEVEVVVVQKFSLVVGLQPFICWLECSLDPYRPLPAH